MAPKKENAQAAGPAERRPRLGVTDDTSGPFVWQLVGKLYLGYLLMYQVGKS